MKEQLITKETAVLGENIGYPFYTYPNVPTQSLLQKWLFNNHNIWVSSTPEFNANEMIGISVSISSWRFPFISVYYNGYDVYEGLEKGLQEALKLI